MNPADLARQNAIPLEVKKDGLSQRQSGDWVIRFVVQAADMDQRLTSAPMGTRFQVALVEINDDETPVHQPAKEVAATPQPMPHTAGAKRMEWRELQPAAQAGIRCEDPVFRSFLDEKCSCQAVTSEDAAEAVREICCIQSRAELCINHKARVLWHQLDESFQAWKLAERAGV